MFIGGCSCAKPTAGTRDVPHQNSSNFRRILWSNSSTILKNQSLTWGILKRENFEANGDAMMRTQCDGDVFSRNSFPD